MPDQQDRSELLVSAAILLHQAGKDSRAIEILSEVVQENPSYISALVLLGALNQATASFKESEASYRKALELDPVNAEALQGLGLFLVSQKRFPEALPYLRAHFEKNQTDEKTINGLLETLENLSGRESEIEEILRTAWQCSQDGKVGVRYAQYLEDRRNLDAARQVLSTIVSRSKNADAFAELALVCINIKALDDAETYAREAISINPSLERAWRFLSQAMFRKGDNDGALEAIEQSIFLDPNQKRNWLDKIRILADLDRYEEILAILDEKLITDKNTHPALLAEIYSRRIEALANLQRIDDALTEALKARERFKDIFTFYELVIIILGILEKYDRVLQEIDSTRKLFNKNTDNLYAIEYEARLCLGQTSEAKDVLSAYLSTPEIEEKIDRIALLGTRLYFSQKRKEAEELYRQLIDCCPGVLRVKTNLGYILIGEGKLQEAEQLLLQVVNYAESDVYITIACCDLAYLYSLIGDLENAVKMAERAIRSEFTQQTAILRIPQIKNGVILPDQNPFPGHDMLIGNNAQACLALAAWAQGQHSIALQALQSISDDKLRQDLEVSLGNTPDEKSQL